MSENGFSRTCGCYHGGDETPAVQAHQAAGRRVRQAQNCTASRSSF